jgi:hypothetical protein
MDSHQRNGRKHSEERQERDKGDENEKKCSDQRNHRAPNLRSRNSDFNIFDFKMVKLISRQK